MREKKTPTLKFSFLPLPISSECELKNVFLYFDFSAKSSAGWLNATTREFNNQHCSCIIEEKSQQRERKVKVTRTSSREMLSGNFLVQIDFAHIFLCELSRKHVFCIYPKMWRNISKHSPTGIFPDVRLLIITSEVSALN